MQHSGEGRLQGALGPKPLSLKSMALDRCVHSRASLALTLQRVNLTQRSVGASSTRHEWL